jgi:dephospho-CoA kinase
MTTAMSDVRLNGSVSSQVVMPAILFLTGASGVGKTSVVATLQAGDPASVYRHFDSIGVPDHDTMVRQYGSGERWQSEMTRRWVAKIMGEYSSRPLVVLEGQARPSFVQAALTEYRVSRSAVVLIDCDDEERERRLLKRGQPELANESMRSWATFLRRDARTRGLVRIDSTKMSVADVATAVRDLAQRLLPRAP